MIGCRLAAVWDRKSRSLLPAETIYFTRLMNTNASAFSDQTVAVNLVFDDGKARGALQENIVRSMACSYLYAASISFQAERRPCSSPYCHLSANTWPTPSCSLKTLVPLLGCFCYWFLRTGLASSDAELILNTMFFRTGCIYVLLKPRKNNWYFENGERVKIEAALRISFHVFFLSIWTTRVFLAGWNL